LAAGTEPPDDALKLFVQVLREGAVPSDRQERLYQFPLIIAQFTSRHLSVLPAGRDVRVRIRPYCSRLQTGPSGQVAAGLMAQAPELLGQPPVIEPVDVLAARLPG
jgi:hypothetical protein